MKKIALSKGKFAIVDGDDFEALSKFKWGLTPNGYARRNKRRNGRTIRIYMHRWVLRTPNGCWTDHINGNKLDNRKINLRVCDASQNGANSKIKRTSSTGFKGVRKNYNGWQAHITVRRKLHLLGTYPTKKEAAKAYDSASLKFRGEFAKTNKSLGLL
jgi:hypothetical protein